MNKKAIALLEKMRKHKDIADKNHLKMGWHPGTQSARVFQARFEKHECAYEDAEEALRKLLESI